MRCTVYHYHDTDDTAIYFLFEIISLKFPVREVARLSLELFYLDLAALESGLDG